jgi:hypothetical protein
MCLNGGEGNAEQRSSFRIRVIPAAPNVTLDGEGVCGELKAALFFSSSLAKGVYRLLLSCQIVNVVVPD